MDSTDLYHLLEDRYQLYNSPEFITSDPISIPHRYTGKEDREISGFLVATIAWGQRPTIIKNALRLMASMDDAPHDFILHHQDSDLTIFENFKHRTFNYDDLVFFLTSLKNIYLNHGGLENSFAAKPEETSTKQAISRFRDRFFETPHLERSRKHVSDPFRNSACKRLNMFLRWMARRDNGGVDFGIWNLLQPHQLSCPLDIHSGNVARYLGLLTRRQNDWKAVEELDHSLRKFDPGDPVKYDFALFGMGVFEKLA